MAQYILNSVTILDSDFKNKQLNTYKHKLYRYIIQKLFVKYANYFRMIFYDVAPKQSFQCMHRTIACTFKHSQSQNSKCAALIMPDGEISLTF